MIPWFSFEWKKIAFFKKKVLTRYPRVTLRLAFLSCIQLERRINYPPLNANCIETADEFLPEALGFPYVWLCSVILVITPEFFRLSGDLLIRQSLLFYFWALYFWCYRLLLCPGQPWSGRLFILYIRFYSIDRTLLALWLVKNLCFIRVYSLHYFYIIKQMKKP